MISLLFQYVISKFVRFRMRGTVSSCWASDNEPNCRTHYVDKVESVPVNKIQLGSDDIGIEYKLFNKRCATHW
jgi:hypothetical protein